MCTPRSLLKQKVQTLCIPPPPHAPPQKKIRQTIHVTKTVSLNNNFNNIYTTIIYNSVCLSFSSSIRCIKSVFSMHPLHSSSQLCKIFRNCFTLIFFRSTFRTSIFCSEIIQSFGIGTTDTTLTNHRQIYHNLLLADKC